MGGLDSGHNSDPRSCRGPGLGFKELERLGRGPQSCAGGQAKLGTPGAEAGLSRALYSAWTTEKEPGGVKW